MGNGRNQHYHFLPGQPSDRERYRAAQKVTLVGAFTNALLALGKIIAGYLGQSQALIADGVHSVSDLATDAMVLVAAKHASKEADESHPYGHARIETAVTVALGVVLILVAIGIALDATARLFHPEKLLHPGILALTAAILSVLANEWLYQYTIHVARKIRSNLLKANAWHHRSDAISSVVVIVGVVGTMAGLPYLDAIAAIGVALMIIKIGWDLAWHSLRELVDTALAADRVEAIREVIRGVDGVRALHMLRTRRMGQDALVDVHILVDPKLSVSEGHYISETVRSRVVEKIEEVQDVLVHIDPEDDENARPSIDLPPRGWLLAELKPLLADAGVADRVRRITLHYLNGNISVELYLDRAVMAQTADLGGLERCLAGEVAALEAVSDLTIFYC